MKKTLLFIFGVAIGAAATFKLAKDKYERIAQEEIDSVKERFSEMKKSNDDEKEVVEENNDNYEEYYDEPQNIVTNKYRNLASSYNKPSNHVKKDNVNAEVKEDEPYVISEEDFGEYDDYEKISLLYFADNVLTDDNYDLVDDVDDTVGITSLTNFHEYEVDSVYVRNDRLKCDYEITLDHRNYSDVIETMPYIIR